jgi:succinate dehydrogenase hydrophobic anchor subunit
MAITCLVSEKEHTVCTVSNTVDERSLLLQVFIQLLSALVVAFSFILMLFIHIDASIDERSTVGQYSSAFTDLNMVAFSYALNIVEIHAVRYCCWCL